MKITTKKLSYEKATAKKPPKHRKPLRPLFILQILIRNFSIFDLRPTPFTNKWDDRE